MENKDESGGTVVFDESGTIFEDGDYDGTWCWARKPLAYAILEGRDRAINMEQCAERNRLFKPFRSWLDRQSGSPAIQWPFIEGKRYRVVIYELPEDPAARVPSDTEKS